MTDLSDHQVQHAILSAGVDNQTVQHSPPKLWTVPEVLAEPYFSTGSNVDDDVGVCDPSLRIFQDVKRCADKFPGSVVVAEEHCSEKMQSLRLTTNVSATRDLMCPGLARARREEFIERVINWTSREFLNDKLLLDELRPIPRTFSDCDEYSQTFYPFVLEEMRFQISQKVLQKHFKLAERFKFEVSRGSHSKLIVRVDKGNWETVKQTPPCLALIVESAAAATSPPLSGDTLSTFKHMLVSISVDKWSDPFGKKKISEDSVHFNAHFPMRSTLIHQFLQSEQFSGWDLYFLDVETTAHVRITNALLRVKTAFPRFMSIILSGQIHGDPVTNYSTHAFPSLAQEARAKEREATTFMNHQNLNKSQRKAIKNILDGTAPIYKIKGPPGTGKTSTIVALLLSIAALKNKVHVTAPSNVAVCVLAKRFMESVTKLNPCIAQTIRLSKVLLVGNKTKMKVEDDNMFDRIFLESRVERLYTAAFKTLPVALDLFSRIVRNKHYARASDSQSSPNREEMIAGGSDESDLTSGGGGQQGSDIVEVFSNKINEFENLLAIFVIEAPEHFRCVLGEKAVTSVQQACAFLLKLPRDSMRDWLVEEKEASVDTKSACSIISLFFSDLYSQARALSSDVIFRHRNLMNEVTKEATVVFSTVNGGGKRMFDFLSFEVCIVDEAAQLVEAELSILLRHNLRCLVLVGDEKQLPSTVTAPAAQRMGFGESMFGRFANYPCYLLNTQYRMLPSISRFPLQTFYDGKVIDGDNVRSLDFNNLARNTRLPPLSMYDVRFGAEQTTESCSKFNEPEATIVRQIVNEIRHSRNAIGPVSVGILSPYAEQVRLLRPLENLSTESFTIVVSSVDAFQGQESDIVIFSAVRSNNIKSLGFLKDLRRLNVAITRARFALVLVCNVKTVSSDSTWRELVTRVNYLKSMKTHDDCDIIRRCRNSFLNIRRTPLDEIHQCVEGAPWRVDITDKFLKEFSAFDIRTRNAFAQVIHDLAHGKWPKHKFEKINADRNVQDFVHARIISKSRLIWSVDVSHSFCTQVLKLWDIVDKKVDRVQAYSTVTAAVSKYSAEYITRCSLKERSATKNKLFAPHSWDVGEEFVWFKSPTKAKPRRRQAAP